MCILQALFALLHVVMYFTSLHGKWGYAIFVFCLFFCVGGLFSSIFISLTVILNGNQFTLPANSINTVIIAYTIRNYSSVYCYEQSFVIT